MLNTETTLNAYFMPEDRVQALTDLVALIDSAQPGDIYRQILYGFTSRPIADAILRAYTRGVDCRLILDHTQSAGRTEAALLHSMMLAGFPPDRIHIGTSTEHGIIHDKVAVVVGKDVPDAYFDTWQQARAVGYPVVVEGSYNWSESANHQVNTLILMPSKPFAAHVLKIFDAQWAWLTTAQPQYQPVAP